MIPEPKIQDKPVKKTLLSFVPPFVSFASFVVANLLALSAGLQNVKEN